MRYTTSAFGETVRLIGRFTSGLAATDVQLTLFNLETGAVQPITSANCIELSGSAFGGRSVYVWPTSNITTQPTAKTEFLYVMQDTTTGQIQEGKVVLGGFPDESAIGRYNGAVYIDTTGFGSAGTAFPIGTSTNPVNNITDAATIAAARGFRKYIINGAITITTNHENWEFEGIEPRQDIVTVSGVSVNNSSFRTIGIRGQLSGTISASECLVGPTTGGTLGVDGVFRDTGFAGTIRIANGAVFRGLRVNFLDLTGTIIDFNNPGTVTQFLAITSGNFIVRNATINVLSGVVLNGGQVTHEATITNMTSYLYGYGQRSVLGGATFLIDVDEVIRGSFIDDFTSTRAAPGDAMSLVADALNTTSLAASGASEIATAVDALLASNHGAGSWATAVGFATAADVQRLHGENLETVIFTATAAIPSGQNGRFVPAGGISHLRVRVKAEAASDWSAPTDTYFVVFNYFPGALATDRSAAAATQAAAPSDGTFTSVTPP